MGINKIDFFLNNNLLILKILSILIFCRDTVDIIQAVFFFVSC